jgi:hypothetical protein
MNRKSLRGILKTHGHIVRSLPPCDSDVKTLEINFVSVVGTGCLWNYSAEYFRYTFSCK